MTKLFAHMQAFMADKRGATAIEYGLIAAGVAVTIAAAVFAFGGSLEQLFIRLSQLLSIV